MKIVANGCSSVLSFSVTITDVETHIYDVTIKDSGDDFEVVVRTLLNPPVLMFFSKEHKTLTWGDIPVNLHCYLIDLLQCNFEKIKMVLVTGVQDWGLPKMVDKFGF